MVELVDNDTVLVQPVNRSVFKIGDKELTRVGIKDDIADADAAIVGDCCEQAHFAGLPVNAINASGAAADVIAKLAFHP